jgi:hypothetical protein
MKRSAVITLVAALGAGSLIPVPLARGAVTCGEERWSIKTLSDRHAADVNFAPVRTTVSRLRSKARPDVHQDSPRLRPVEYNTYKVRAKVTLTAREDDHDYHLVIAAPKHRHRTMIVEFPDPRCKGAASSLKRRSMARARRAFEAACGPIGTSFKDLHGTALIKGVGFWDFDHGQTGVAPNAIELHPVLHFKMVHGSC